MWLRESKRSREGIKDIMAAMVAEEEEDVVVAVVEAKVAATTAE